MTNFILKIMKSNQLKTFNANSVKNKKITYLSVNADRFDIAALCAKKKIDKDTKKSAKKPVRNQKM